MTTNGIGTRPLPDGWTWTTVKEMTDIIQYGHTESANYEPIGPKFLRITDIQNGQVDWDPVPYCICTQEEHRKYALQNGDTVFARTGATTGKSFLILNCPDAVFASYLIRLRVPPSVDSKYLSYFFQTPFYWLQIVTVRKGSAQPGVNATILAELHVPLAPLNQQNRIVAEIEKQFTRLDQAVVSLRRLQTNLSRYKASVLKAACAGRLVPQDPTDEPAEGLLQRILTERGTLWQTAHPGKKYEEPTDVETSDLLELPSGWVWVTLEQMSALITSGSRGWSQYYSDEGVIFIRAQDINTDSLKLDSVAHVLLPDKAEGTRARVNQNDLLITVTGANVTKTALVVQELTEAYVSQHVGLVRPISPKTASFLYFWIISPAYGRHILEKAAYGAGKPGLSLENLRELIIALPPLPEQQRIVAEVERRLSVITATEQAITTNLARAERLRQSILHRAFTGQLVPQDA